MTAVDFGTGLLFVLALSSLVAAIAWVSATEAGAGRPALRAVVHDRWVLLAGLFSLSGLALVSPAWPLRVLLSVLVLAGAMRLVQLNTGFAQGLSAQHPISEPAPRAGQKARRKTSRIACRLVGLELVVLGLLAPVFLFGGLSVLLALPVLPALWGVRRLARGYFVPRTALGLPILLLLIMVLVSLFATPDIAISLGKAGGLLYGICLYFALVDWDGGKAAVRWLAVGFLGAGTLLAGLGLAGTAWFDKFTLLAGVVRGMPILVRGWQGAEAGFQPNEVGGSLLWVVLPLLAMLASALILGRDGQARPRPRTLTPLLVGALVVTSGTLVLTQSRGALLGAGAGILLLVTLARPRFGGLVATLALICALLVLMADASPGAGDASTIPDYGSLTNPANLAVRQEIWAAAVQTIARHPLGGVGMNVFRRIMVLDFQSPLIPCDYDVGHAHNQLLQAALDLGVPGLVGYLALWMTAGRVAVSAWRGAPEPWMRALAAGLLAAGVAFLSFGLTDAVALGAKPGLLFWAALALVVRLHATVPLPRTLPPQAVYSNGDAGLVAADVAPQLAGATGWRRP